MSGARVLRRARLTHWGPLTQGGNLVLAACFSTERDDLAQWRYYGDDGRGIAIGFRSNTLLWNLGSPWESNLHHVIYDETAQLELMRQTLTLSFCRNHLFLNTF